MTNLVVEYVSFEVNHNGDAVADAALVVFLKNLPVAQVPKLATLDRVLYANIVLALDANDYRTAIAIMTAPGAAGCFPTFASQGVDLVRLWMKAMIQQATAVAGHALTPWQQRQVRVDNPVPRNIGCQYGGGESELNCYYW